MEHNWIHYVFVAARVLFVLVVGFVLIRLLRAAVSRLTRKRLSDQWAMLVSKASGYAATIILLIVVLRELGFQLTTLLGAAGIAGVAIGFASQTSLSNLISGLFLIWEKPFEIGDVIQVGDTTGVVHAIDLLSLKMRTFDNRFVRIPNETLVKTQFTNVTRFPIRRLDVDVGVAYKEDVDHVTRVLKEVADANPFSLDEPPPLVLFKGFGDSALEFLFGVWFQKTDMLSLRNSIMRDIKARFDAEGIEIPFPHRTLYVGSATDPFPVRVVPEGKKPPAAAGE